MDCRNEQRVLLSQGGLLDLCGQAYYIVGRTELLLVTKFILCSLHKFDFFIHVTLNLTHICYYF